jgi:hypothetical protein
MFKFVLALLLTAAAAWPQYKSEPAGAPPADVPAAIGKTLAKDGQKVVDASGKTIAEFWFRAELPKTPPNSEENVSINTLPHGALLGIVRFPARYADRRGQTIKPGIYTLRYSLFPINGDHQGVAPQRDFFILVEAGDDKDPAANISYEALMPMSMKAMGTPHPGVFSIWKQDADFKPGVAPMGDHDWVLYVKVGDLQLGIIVVGKAEG